MRPFTKAPVTRPTNELAAFIARSQAAADDMAKRLRAELKHWNLQLLSWEDGKFVAFKP